MLTLIRRSSRTDDVLQQLTPFVDTKDDETAHRRRINEDLAETDRHRVPPHDHARRRDQRRSAESCLKRWESLIARERRYEAGRHRPGGGLRRACGPAWRPSSRRCSPSSARPSACAALERARRRRRRCRVRRRYVRAPAPRRRRRRTSSRPEPHRSTRTSTSASRTVPRLARADSRPATGLLPLFDGASDVARHRLRPR